MKHKFSSMGRVAIALVLALSLSLVMTVPVSAAEADLTPDYAKAGDADVPILSWDITETGGTTDLLVDSIDVTFTGTADPTLVTAIIYDPTEAEYGSAPFPAGGIVTIDGDYTVLKSGTGEFTLKFDIGATVADGATVDGKVDSIVPSGGIAGGTALPYDPAGSTTIDNELNATVTLIPASSKGDTSVNYTLTVTDVEAATEGAGISEVKLSVPASGGYAVYVVTNINDPTVNWSHGFSNDGHSNISIITWTADAGFEIAAKASLDFTFTATTTTTEADYSWTIDTTDQAANTDSDTETTAVDDTAPAAPVADLLVVTMNTSPTEDTIEGSAGAVEANATVKVYSDEALCTLIDSAAAAADGSFAAIDIGDDTNAEVWVTATDAAGNESLATSKLNDIIGPPLITAIVGTTYQNGNDTIVITFGKDVQPATEGPWYAAVFAIKCGTVDLSLVGASFTPASGLTSTLTITLDEDVDYLVNGVKVYVTPAASAIKDAFDNFVPNTQAESATIVSGDGLAPTVALTYNPDRNVKDADTLTITATFSEAMQDTPQIAIATQGDGSLSATDMSMGTDRTVWTYAWDVASGADEDGTATVTITGNDLAGNSMTDSTNTFDIDNTVPTIAAVDVVGSTTGAKDTITITFSEDVDATDGDFTDGNEVAGITLKKTGEADVTVDLTGATFAYAANDLTITLAETGNVPDYLLNGYTVTFDPSDTNTIEDSAVNLLDTAAIDGTDVIGGDTDAPTMDKVVGMIKTGDDTITIAFSEKVRPADGTWSADEFSIESPATAPLNIDHANFAPDATNTILTITLNQATDGAFLVVGSDVKVTPVALAVLDLAGNSLPTTPVTSAVVIADPAYPYITSIVGTTILGAGDTIIITFSEAVAPAEATPVWSDSEFTRIEAPNGTDLTLTNATFSIDGTNTILTITLDEATDGEYLVNEEAVSATPAGSAIEDADGNPVPDTEVESAAVVSGDTDAPTIVSIVGTIVPGTGAGEGDIIRIDFSEAVVPVDNTWSDNEFTITGAGVNLAVATFAPASGITSTLTITLADANSLNAGETLTVTPVVDKVIDLAGNKMSDEVDSTAPVQAPSAAFVINLEADWNLISLPLVPTDTDIETVLAGLVNANTVIQVRAYNASDKSWSIWASTGPYAWNPTLTEMNDGLGFWIEMSTGDNLVASGSVLPAPPLTPPSYSVYEGWNLIGFKSLTPVTPLSGYLGTLVDGTREAIYVYNAGLYEITGTFEPGYGYWLAVNAPGTIYP